MAARVCVCVCGSVVSVEPFMSVQAPGRALPVHSLAELHRTDLCCARADAGCAGRARPLLRRRLPILRWLPTYGREDAVADLVAGFTLGLTLIPQSIAYALLAGLSPQVKPFPSAEVLEGEGICGWFMARRTPRGWPFYPLAIKIQGQ